MSDGTSRNVFIGSWVLAFVLITWASFSQKKGMPPPAQIIKASAVWTILGIVSEGAPKLAGLMGMGLLIPLFFIAQGGNPNSPSLPGATTASASGAVASGLISGGI
jgi:hypothetical protein